MLGRCAFHVGDIRLIISRVAYQTRRDLPDLGNGPVETAALWKSEAIDRAVSAHARDAAEKRVAGDLTRDETGIELKHDFVPTQFAQVIGISGLSVERAQFAGRKANSIQKTRTFSSIEVEDRHLLAGLRAELARNE